MINIRKQVSKISISVNDNQGCEVGSPNYQPKIFEGSTLSSIALAPPIVLLTIYSISF